MTETEENKRQDIIDNLVWDDSVAADDVLVDVQDGTAILKGTVPSYSSKVAAENDAFMVPGILVVENKLEIGTPTGLDMPEDEEITANIQQKLLSASQLNPAMIDVQTEEGTVHLSGEVNTFWELHKAEEIALSTKGVVGIINDLVVRLSDTVLDTDIEEDIKATLRRSAFIDQDDIYVHVKNGIVTLTGRVSDYNTRSRAYNIAMYTKGVVEVINDIKIL